MADLCGLLHILLHAVIGMSMGRPAGEDLASVHCDRFVVCCPPAGKGKAWDVSGSGVLSSSCTCTGILMLAAKRYPVTPAEI
jgi:hypothetical protein